MELEMLNKKEAIEILGITMITLNRMIRDKKIPYYKLGEGKTASVRFLKKDVIEYIENHKVN